MNRINVRSVLSFNRIQPKYVVPTLKELELSETVRSFDSLLMRTDSETAKALVFYSRRTPMLLKLNSI